MNKETIKNNRAIRYLYYTVVGGVLKRNKLKKLPLKPYVILEFLLKMKTPKKNT